MTALSININKIATLRNARGGNIPNLIQHAIDLEKFGAQELRFTLGQMKDILDMMTLELLRKFFLLNLILRETPKKILL